MRVKGHVKSQLWVLWVCNRDPLIIVCSFLRIVLTTFCPHVGQLMLWLFCLASHFLMIGRIEGRFPSTYFVVCGLPYHTKISWEDQIISHANYAYSVHVYWTLNFVTEISWCFCSCDVFVQCPCCKWNGSGATKKKSGAAWFPSCSQIVTYP